MDLSAILDFPFSFGHYAGLVYAALERNRSIEVTRIAPGRWIAEQVRRGTRVGFYSQSNVTLPQIWDMPYNFSTELFNFPYLDADKMRQFRPPSFADLEARYDVLLLSDCHVWIYDYTFQRCGAEDRRAEWSNFVEELGRRYRTIRFAAPTPNYCVKEVDIYVIHPEALTARPLESERPTLH